MKTTMTFLSIILLGLIGFAQNGDNYNPYFQSVTFKIGGGVMLPQGELSNYFQSSPLVELSLDFPVTDSKSLELALQFVIPNQEQSFDYEIATDVLSTKATFIFNPIFRFKKNFSKSENTKWLLGIGLGTSTIKTNAEKLSGEENQKYETITTFLVSPSIDYVKTFKNNNEFTFSLGLNYSPYKVGGAIQEDIGSIAITPRLLYSF